MLCEKIHSLVVRDCYGCLVNHPSQREHSCLGIDVDLNLIDNFELYNEAALLEMDVPFKHVARNSNTGFKRFREPTMVRNYKRKTNRAETASDDIMKVAADRVIRYAESIRKVADDYNINFMTLHRYCKKLRAGQDATVGYTQTRIVFAPTQEKLPVDYILKASKIYYGLSPREVREFAYEFAVSNNIQFPPNWADKGRAGADWFSGFIKRHNSLSIRTPEATSLSRATSFNRTNVDKFFNNLSEVLDRYKFLCSDIYNIDETGITTVQQPNRIVAQKGAKQVGAVTSAERGTLVTMVLAVSANGNTVPPMFIFPRVNFRDHFINAGPRGCIGAAYPSGWMTEKNFLIFIRHFINVTKCTKDKPVLLLMDNHDSHVSLELIDLCRENGIIIVTFPPHCSHKLQPLDRSVYGPFKKFFNAGCDGWMKRNPGKTMTIYDIPGITTDALSLATTALNIQNGFKVSGVYPFNRNVFGEDEFLPSSVTDRPLEEIPQINDNISGNETQDRPAAEGDLSSEPETSGSTAIELTPPSETRDASATTSSGESDVIVPETPQVSSTYTIDKNNADSSNQPGTSAEGHADDLPLGVVVSPEMLRPFKKASPRKGTGCTRKKRHTAILTDTPEREKLRFAKENAEKKKSTKRKLTSDNSISKKPIKKHPMKCSKKSQVKYNCLVCGEDYADSRLGEKWVECTSCMEWSHEECTNGDRFYVCHLCDSDEEQ